MCQRENYFTYLLRNNYICSRYYICSINLSGRFVVRPDLLTLGIFSVMVGVCAVHVLANVSAAGLFCSNVLLDSSALVVAGEGSDDGFVDGDEVGSRSGSSRWLGISSTCSRRSVLSCSR